LDAPPRDVIAPTPSISLQEDSPMPKLTLNIEALQVESFAIAQAGFVIARPTTTGTGMNTNEPGCTLPELCGTTVLA
jgi:hypothetical protein